MNYVLEGLLIIIGFGSILFLAYITTRYIAGKSNAAMKGRYINIVESVSLGLDKRLYLVKVEKTYVLLASSSKSIEFLTSVNIDETEADAEERDRGAGFNFRDMFDKYIQQYLTKKTEKPLAGTDVPADSGQFRNEPFKSNLERLRSITYGINKQNLDGGDDNTSEKI